MGVNIILWNKDDETVKLIEFGLFDLYSFSSILQSEVSKMPLLREQNERI